MRPFASINGPPIGGGRPDFGMTGALGVLGSAAGAPRSSPGVKQWFIALAYPPNFTPYRSISARSSSMK